MKAHAEKQLFTLCPQCKTPIPVATITVERTGFLGRKVAVMYNGGSEDFVAHAWTHFYSEAQQ